MAKHIHAHVATLSGGHVPMLSMPQRVVDVMPQRVVDVIIDAATKTAN